MRTKALLVAAVLAAGLATSMAENVYSLNVVGYHTVTVPANGYALIANQLDSGDNTLKSVIPVAPDGAIFYKFDGGASKGYMYDELEPGWTPNGDVTLAPGEGGMFKNNTASPLNITFVGEVLQGEQTASLPQGYSVRSSKFPIAESLTSMELPAADGDLVYVFSGDGYTGYMYDELEPGWTPGNLNGPTIKVGEAFFIKKVAAASWVRNFTVPQN